MDAVGVLTLDRPGRCNRLDPDAAQSFLEASGALSADEDVRVVVVRGAGGNFCAGVDASPVAPNRGKLLEDVLVPLHGALCAIQRAPKPFVAAVDGLAAASGIAVALACDLVVCSERASLEWADPETGAAGAESSTFFLPRLLGSKAAMEIALLAPRLSAFEARSLGLVNAVHPVSRMGSEVMGLASRLAAGPTRAYAAAKALVNEASGVDGLDAHLGRERAALVHLHDGGELASAPEARRRFPGGR